MPKPRYQDPPLKRTKNGAWFIRAWVDVPSHGLYRSRRRSLLAQRQWESATLSNPKNRIMSTLNRSDYIIQSQVPFGEFLDHYVKNHVHRYEVLASSTRAKYLIQIKNHIRQRSGI